MPASALALEHIHKTCGTTHANRDVSLTVLEGEIHAVVGENGAGKSTLLRIAAGLQSPDSGQIFIRGERVEHLTAAIAISKGVGMVQQHFALIPPFTVTENVVLGCEPGSTVTLDRARATTEVQALANELGFSLDVTRTVESLSVGEQQRVEILKVLYRKARVLILDEPTAVLAPQEVEELFQVLRTLVSKGCTVVFVTHKLREVMAIADRVSVMRRGEVVSTVPVAETSLDALTEAMLGGTLAGMPSALERTAPTAHAVPGSLHEDALQVEGLNVRDAQGREVLRNVSLALKRGEILGIAGVQGNGQTELIEAIAGILPYHGKVRLAGRSLEGLNAGQRLQAGLSHIPEDRLARGVVLDFSVRDNFALGALKRYSRAGVMRFRSLLEAAQQNVARYDLRPPDTSLPVSHLSGGNQQKLVVSRELDRMPSVLLAAQPTRGVDLGAMARIYQALQEARANGMAILLVSADLTELMTLADRIAVMYRGELVGSVTRAEASEATLGAWMMRGNAGATQKMPLESTVTRGLPHV